MKSKAIEAIESMDIDGVLSESIEGIKAAEFQIGALHEDVKAAQAWRAEVRDLGVPES